MPRLARVAFAATFAFVFVARASNAGDEAELRALHAKGIQAHRESNPALLFENASEDFLEANRGAISRPTLEERRARFSAYLGSTRFEEYRDLVEPIVKVSKDGTLVQVKARGVHTTAEGKQAPLEFVSAWIELYEKRDGRWISVGNVSNFK
jgi:hypothetical protein